ncbi:MAG: YlxR family protein, partial [Defluviitaleaceae bacterium]|nr:YlxR family protein [Defluviitaleaceae bacterium]
MIDKRELLRIVKTPEDNFCIDETGKASGRGA